MVHRDARRCRLHRSVLSGLTGGLTPGTGFRAYQREGVPESTVTTYGTDCEITDQCTLLDHFTCNSGVCRCDRNYKYNPSTDSCVEECDVLGSEFVGYDGVIVSGDTATIFNQSKEECIARCIAREDWICRSFDYAPSSSTCWLSDKAPGMDNAETRDWPGIFLYVRQCAQ